MFHLDKNIIQEILNHDFWKSAYIIDNFLIDDFAEELFKYINNSEFNSIKCNLWERHIIESSELKKSNTVISKWIEYFSSKESIFNKILSIKYKKKFFYISWKCTGIYKYYYWNHLNIHLDTDSGEWVDKLLKYNVWKDIAIHISLSKNWKEWDWGELVFYNKTDNNNFVEIQRCAPGFNQLWIYNVHQLYHEVLPVKSKDFVKITIANWYHSFLNNQIDS